MQLTEAKRKALTKRLADFLEKASVASFAVGVFQGSSLGAIIGTFCLALPFWISYLEA